MRRIKLFLGATVIASTISAAPAWADRSDCSKPLERHYSAHWHAVKDHLGHGAQGRNIRALGKRYRTSEGYKVRDARCGELRRSLAQLRQLRNPVSYPKYLVRTAIKPSQPPAGVKTPSVAGRYGGSSIPSYIVACESGGDYNAYNPSSAATGKYQILPSTASAYGCDLSTPGGQDECAAKIYADVGASAWSCG